jgi:hypothetical protein
LVTSGAVFNGMFTGDVLNVATSAGVFTDPRAATNKTVSISGITLGGTDAGNYTLTTSTASTAATINPKALTVTALPQTKVYDSTTSVASTTAYNVSAMVGSESLSGVTLAYSNANVSRDGSGNVLSNKTITVSAAQAGSGTVLSDYLINYVSNTTSTITPYAVTLTGGRVYDATTTVAASKLTIGTLINQETLDLSGAGTLADKNVGQNKAVDLGTLSLVDGTNGGLAINYALTGPRTASITQAAVTITTRDVVKTYDGTLSVAGATTTASPIVLASSGTQMFGSDTLSGGSYAFTDQHAGSANRTVTVASVTVNDGNGGNNYTVTYAHNTTSTINPKALTVTALPQTKVYDSTTSVASTTAYNVSAMVGSESLSGVTLAYANPNVSRDGSGNVLSNKTITVSAAQATAGTFLSDYLIS